MTDLLFPPAARVSSSGWDAIGNAAISRSIFTQALRSTGRTGDHFRIGFNISNANDRETYALRANLSAIRSALRGQANRIWISDPSYRQRGSFPSQELLTNNTFANGTTGWTASNGVGVVNDRIYRLTYDGSTGGSFSMFRTGISVTQYAPYVFRVGFGPSNNAGLNQRAIFSASGVAIESSVTNGGLAKIAQITDNTSGNVQAYSLTTGLMSGSFLDISYLSWTRCALIDNSPNLFLYSDQFDNAAWTKNVATINANVAVPGPDGTTSVVDQFVENTTATNSPTVSQTFTCDSVTEDIVIGVMAQRNARNFILLELIENTGSTGVYRSFDLLNGVVGITHATGGNWSNERSFIIPMGNNWYACFLVARKTNAATSLTGYIIGAASDSGSAYAMTAGTNICYLWRGGAMKSTYFGTPLRFAQTTSSVSLGSSQTGSSLYLKGLPISTNGLLLPGDLVQIGNQLNVLTGPLDSNSGGLGYLQCAFPWRAASTDNDPVIINTPMARCALTNNVGGWKNNPGGFSDFEFQFEESLDA